MPTEFKIPELGENVTAGDVVRVLVKAGDTLTKDQPVLELETDKATIEVPSNVSGTVGEVKVKQGDKVKVGQVVLTLSDGQAEGAEAEKPAADAAKPAAAETAKPAAAEAAKPAEEKQAPKAARTDKAAAADKGAAEPARKEGASRAKTQPLGGPEDGGLSQAAVPGRVSEEDAEPEEEGLTPQRPRGEVVDINRGARASQPSPVPEAGGQRRPAGRMARRERRVGAGRRPRARETAGTRARRG